MDTNELSSLIKLLKENNVSEFSQNGLRLVFHVEPPKPIETKDHVIPDDESMLPPDLRTDNITDYDKILNWSGSPDHQETEIPLTGDAPLEV